MASCARCGRRLTFIEALGKYHRCDDGLVLVACSSLEAWVEPDYHQWIHDVAHAFDAYIVTLPTSMDGHPQPFLWRMAA